MEKRQIGRLWLVIVLVTNVTFVLYLYRYQEAGDFYSGVPEALIVFLVLVGAVGTVNSVMGWLYLGKPDLSELFAVEQSEQTKPTLTTEDD